MGQLGWVWFGGVDALPFYIITIIDNSGSLTTNDIPSVFTAVEQIGQELVSLGTLTASQQDSFILSAEPEDERYLQWLATYPETLKPQQSNKCVVLIWQDEASPVYHDEDDGSGLLNQFYIDLGLFTSFVGRQEVELLGAKIFALPEEIAFVEHLSLAFAEKLQAFRNIYDEQMLEYSITLTRNQFPVNYAYNLMSDYLNNFLDKENFNLLPLR